MSTIVPTDATRLQLALVDLKNEVRDLRMVILGNKALEQEGIVLMVKRHDRFIAAITSKWSMLCTSAVVGWTIYATIHYGSK